jgi:aryl-alcohol dehydrogenase-like predicted oxidoreductase
MGLGTGGPSALGQSSGVPEQDARNVVRRALDLGINLIDTAAAYRESEGILGRALRGLPRDSYVLCTKFGPVRDRSTRAASGTDQAPLRSVQEMIDSLERSLQRLQTSYVDVFQLHGVPPDWYAAVRDRFVPVMKRLQEQGKFRFLGITETFANDDHHEALRQALADDLYDTMMVGYNLLSPMPEEHVLPEAQRRDVGILVMCAVRRAIGRPDRLEALIADLKSRGELAADAVPAKDPLGWLVHDHVDAVPSAAYKFAAGHPAVSCVLTGTANIHHLEDNVRAILGPPLADTDRRRLLDLFRPIRRCLGN